MSTSVKYITNSMRGAPQISGTPGTLIAALDALFTTGWGSTTPLSVSVTAGVASASLATSETFDVGAVVLIQGATPSALNGEARVLTSSSTSITWATTAPDGAATGAISIRYAPQTAWQKVFAATNVAVYRSSHVQSNGHFLRVDDTDTTAARVRGFESMTDAVTGTGPFPTDAQFSGGGHWWKSAVASSTAVRYRLLCDQRFLIVCIAAGSSGGATNVGAPPRGFGDPIALAPGGDAWGTLLSVSSVVAINSHQVSSGDLSGGSTIGLVAPRAITGLGGAVQINARAFTSGIGATSGGDDFLGSLPSAVDGQVKMSQLFVFQTGISFHPRALVPGVLYIPQSGAWGPLADGDVLSGTGALADRRLLVQAMPPNHYQQPPHACCLLDTTGPWR